MTLWTVGILTILLFLIVKKNWRSSGQGKIFKPVLTRDVRFLKEEKDMSYYKFVYPEYD